MSLTIISHSMLLRVRVQVLCGFGGGWVSHIICTFPLIEKVTIHYRKLSGIDLKSLVSILTGNTSLQTG